MIKIPARFIQISLVAVVLLILFGGGMYVSISSQNKYKQAQIQKVQDQSSKPYFESNNVSPETDTTRAFTQLPNTNETSSDDKVAGARTQTFGSLASYTDGCYTSCDYTFECPNQLECVTKNGHSICVDPNFPDDATCSSSYKTVDRADADVQADETTERGIGGRYLLAQAVPTATPRPTISPTPTPRPTIAPTPRALANSTLGTDDTLLVAGNQNTTVLLLLFGTVLLGSGILFVKKNQ